MYAVEGICVLGGEVTLPEWYTVWWTEDCGRALERPGGHRHGALVGVPQ